MKRRSFLGALVAAAYAPVLMPLESALPLPLVQDITIINPGTGYKLIGADFSEVDGKFFYDVEAQISNGIITGVTITNRNR